MAWAVLLTASLVLWCCVAAVSRNGACFVMMTDLAATARCRCVRHHRYLGRTSSDNQVVAAIGAADVLGNRLVASWRL